jgi:hypothetical protein
MKSVEVKVPYDLAEQVFAQLQPKVDAMLKVANEVGTILRERAILDNEDVNGNQMPSKQPRPSKSPKNFPNVALIQADEIDEMNPSRWSVEQTTLTEAVVKYNPSDHHQYLTDKAPQSGGRKWLTQESMNPTSRQEIERRMAEEFERASQ